MGDDRNAYGTGRLTEQRRRVARSASAMPGAFTIDDLAEELRSDGSSAVATATLYRAMAALESSGSVERVGVRDGAALYVYCGESGHHHHAVCDGCGHVASAPCSVDTSPLADAGFVVTRHEMTFFGLCPTCAKTPGCEPESGRP